MRVTVFGGNGYVGTSVLKSLLKYHSKNTSLKLCSINRSGKPQSNIFSSTSENIDWIKGNILMPETYNHILRESDCVISCVGSFGSNEFMEKINGDANILLVNESAAAGVKKVIYVSTVENDLPDFILRGYVHLHV